MPENIRERHARERYVRDLGKVPDRFSKEVGQWTFVPLVQGWAQTPSMQSRPGVSLSIVMLRPGVPGGLVRDGDIDNRLKTLFDALHPPQAAPKSHTEGSMFCLLEDDSQIESVSVQTRRLWDSSG